MSPRVEADFVLLDHASGQARDIRREMERLDRAALRAGASLDTVGAADDVQRMENLDRSMSRVNASTGQSNNLLGIFANKWVAIAGLLGAASPLVQGLAGSLVQLVGSLVQAVGGAGVIGGGALGAFAVGLGSVMVVAKGVTSEVTNSYKAFTAYNKAVKDYGASSQQAAVAQRNLNQALALAPQGTMRLLETIKSIRTEWDKATASARNYLVQVAGNVAQRFQAVMPQLGGMVNQNVRAFGGAAQGFLGRALSPDSLRIMAQLSAAFRRDLPPAADALGNLVGSFARLAAAAAPFTKDFLDRFDAWTKRLDLATRDTSYLRFQMSGLVTEFRHWLTFLESAWHLLSTLFSAATRTHTALAGITRQFNAWAKWMQDNPVKMQRFFDQSATATHDLARALGFVVGLILKVGNTLGGLYPTLRQLISNFAGPLAALLVQAATLITTLGSALGPIGGPLTIMLKLLTGVLTAVNDILKAVPGLGFLVSGALTALGIYKMVTAFGTFTGLIPRAATEMGGLTTAINNATAATERLAGAQRGVGIGGGVGGVGGRAAAAEGAAVQGGLMASMFPGRGRAGGLFSRFLGSRGAISPTVSATGEPLAVLGGSSGIRGFFSRRAAAGAGIGTGEALAGEAGTLARGAGMLGRIGGAAGPLSLGLMLASMVAPQTGAVGGALRGASLGSLGMFLGPEVGIPTMAIGALIGGLMSPGADKPMQYVQRQLQGYDHRVKTGTRTVTTPYGTQFEVPTYRTQHIASPLERLGGASPHTASDISGQIKFFHGLLLNLGKDQSKQAVQERTQFQQTIQALRQALPSVKAREQHQGFMAAGQLGRAFNIVAPQQGAGAGMHFVLQQALSQWSSLTQQGKKVLGQQLLDWGAEMKRQNPALVGQFDDIKKSVIGKFMEINGTVQMVNGKVVTDTKAKWAQVQKALTDPVERAKEAISKNFTSIQNEAVGTLGVMGFSPAQARQLVLGISRGGTLQGGLAGMRNQAASQHHHNFASGGRIPGVGTRDTVPLGGGGMAAPGELIVNRHTERHINSMLRPYGTSLGGEVMGENRPHSMNFATGGRWHGFEMPHKRVREVAEMLMRKFPGLGVSSTLRSETGSYHALGEAVDLAAPMNKSGMALMDRAATWAGGNLIGALVEGIHNPTLSVKNYRNVSSDFWGGATWGAHRNHIHVAAVDQGGTMLGGGGQSYDTTRATRAATRRAQRAAGLTMQDLMAGSTSLPGVPGAIVDTTGLELSSGILTRINRILGGGAGPGGAPGGGGTPGTPGGVGGSAGANQALAKHMMLGIWGASQWPYLQSLWTQESGFRTLAKNPSSGAYGIPQSLPANKMASAGADYLTNPATQIKWGLGYISGRYGSPKEAFAHEKAYNWYGEGGDFIARRPHTIGVGDRPERVTITPLSAGGAGHGRHALAVTVHIGHIDATGTPGKIRDMVRGEIRDAIADVADELDRSGNVPDEANA